ncbi:MAG TPA: Spy/CpxP family protein refolding chaperone [Steroidobacteraceae bacterium]|nr:Spy/CpxP family protein refolding chaperone [Steroidobacteraceae bacterium]
MNTNSPSEPAAIAPRRSIFSRATLIAFFAGGALAAGIAALASGAEMSGWHHGMLMDGTHSAAEVSAHVDHVLKHFYVEIDATEAQKAQIGPLVQQAVSDLLPLRAQLQAAHTEALGALTQATIDRAALESARVAHLQVADQASKRFTQLIADVGDLLTPAQRAALAAHLQKMHAMARS